MHPLSEGQIKFALKNLSLGLRLLCNFRDFIYARTAFNTPKRKENLKIASYDPFKISLMYSESFLTLHWKQGYYHDQRTET